MHVAGLTKGLLLYTFKLLVSTLQYPCVDHSHFATIYIKPATYTYLNNHAQLITTSVVGISACMLLSTWLRTPFT